MLRIPPTFTVSLGYYYKLVEQWTSGLGRFLECQKGDILVITQALVLFLIYMHSPSGAVCPWASCVYIKQSTLDYVITYTYIIYS